MWGQPQGVDICSVLLGRTCFTLPHSLLRVVVVCQLPLVVFPMFLHSMDGTELAFVLGELVCCLSMSSVMFIDYVA